ncbi:MAG: SDR family oxidoreductase [Planctomycetota bacterium]
MLPQTQSPFSLEGSTALVTGSTQGVGASIADSIAKAGANVIVHGLKRDSSAEEVIKRCMLANVRVGFWEADLTASPDKYMKSALEAAEGFGETIDCLVCNAGTFIDTPFLQMDLDRFKKTFDLNVTSTFFMVQAFARRWIEAGVKGRIVITGSINGFLAEPDHVAYDSSKGAVASMVQSLCVSLAPHGIRVNSMAPGLVVTPLTQVVETNSKINQWMKLHTPNGQVPGPEVCGDTVVYLLSEAARHVHGQTILVDGGMSAWQQPAPPV